MGDLDNYTYELPEELIAARPLAQRDASRMLVLERETGKLTHAHISDLPEYLREGDCLVLNDTKVVPARLLGERTETGGKWEGLFLGETELGLWTIIGQTRGKIQPGERITLPARHQSDDIPPLFLTLLEKSEEGQWLAEPNLPGGALKLLSSYGTVPLPPYIKRQVPDEEDFERYQTIFAKHPGAVAAPTAGLHFSEELLENCQKRGVQLAYVTLHVGIGTFRPISANTFSEHVMHTEWCEMNQETADILNATRASLGRILPVGTTSVRTLETVTSKFAGAFQAWRGETNLFIYPPYQFQAVDGLVTNFHLPRSTLLVLVSALGGRSHVLRAYQEAIGERYRFFSYGDAMFIC